VYALSRLPRSVATRTCESVVRRLASLSEESWGGTTWYTDAQFLPAWQREQCPDGYYNVGVAHGVPGVIAVLDRAYAAGIEVDTASQLVRGALRWLIARDQGPAATSRYPAWFVPGRSEETTQLAWCYGDLGIAAVLGRLQSPWPQAREHSLWLANCCAERATAPESTQDAGLCHGTTGNAHLFARLWQVHGTDRFRDLARRWALDSLRRYQPGAGIGGFRAAVWDADQQAAADFAFLEGAIGIGLGLLAAVTDVPPDWDGLLLLSGGGPGASLPERR
jgi:lantibiotic biosynthesis protein